MPALKVDRPNCRCNSNEIPFMSLLLLGEESQRRNMVVKSRARKSVPFDLILSISAIIG